MSLVQDCDVLVIGAGNAALCAALSAAEGGARVVVLERAPRDNRGGNSAYTGGAFRMAYDGVEDIRRAVPDLSPEEEASTDFGSYDQGEFFEDLARLSNYRMDADLAEILVAQSLPTVEWMRSHGVRFVPIYGRQAFKVEGRFRFWGGLTIEVSGGGAGLVEALNTAVDKAGIEVIYDCRALSLIHEGATVVGAIARHQGRDHEIRAKAVILAAGGFHANAQWRAAYLGRDWDIAKVRGSRYNSGDGIRMAIDVGAMPYGHWSGCHAVAYDLNAPEFGDLNLLSQQKNSFQFGIMVNARGHRFFDEGADFRNYTYSKLGHAVLEQPGAVAWQVFDNQVLHLLSDEYRVRHATRIEADTIEALAQAMEGIDAAGFLATVRDYNAAIDTAVAFDPTVRDGRCAQGQQPPKSNWANRIEQGPFVAFAVTCGITFTFGGVRTDGDGRVLTAEGETIPGLYAAGEMVGGLYYDTYPGGAGLMSGSVFGRRAGAHAADQAVAMTRDEAA